MPPIRRRTLLQGAAAASFLPLLGCSPNPDARSRSGIQFLHGVASGDPTTQGAILWTRVTPATPESGPVAVDVLVARDAELRDLVLQTRAFAEAAQDFTLKIDLQGLQPGSTYFYAFQVEDLRSPIGRTRTLPSGAVEQLRLAVLTCGDYSRGFFNAYARVAERDDLDAVLHLGDYIYENGNTDRVRPHEPPRKAVSLDEYRTRYAQYRQDADLQALHAQHPMIWIWDDHEFVNNAWRDGAPGHDEASEGPFAARDAAALQAALEWMPIRSPEPARPSRIWRRFAFGDLVDLHMLDTRRFGRDQQIPENTIAGDNLPAFTQTGAFLDPQRQLLGAEQEAWLFAGLQNSTARWQLLGNQVMLAQLKLAGLPNALGGGIYGNPDQWDGYLPARERLYTAIEAGNVSNLVVLTGDFHVAFASELSADPNNPAAYNPLTSAGALGVEFVVPSATSAGDRRALTDPELLTDPADLLEELVVGNPALFRAPNPHIRFSDGRNGFVLLDITPERLMAEFWAVPVVGSPSSASERIATFQVDNGRAALQTLSS